MGNIINSEMVGFDFTKASEIEKESFYNSPEFKKKMGEINSAYHKICYKSIQLGINPVVMLDYLFEQNFV